MDATFLVKGLPLLSLKLFHTPSLEINKTILRIKINFI
jgi:hypothetical protein